MTLLKQGRAFGLGVVLATQNPVDLDYKGLSNTGTWFLGRLQTERDKARMLDGLEGAAAGAMDRGDTDRLLSALDKRVFLLHNVHDKAPVVFQTRWTLSYLRGPLSRDQIRTLTPAAGGQGRRPAGRGQTSEARRRRLGIKGRRPGGRAQGLDAPALSAAPIVSPGIQQFFVPARLQGTSTTRRSSSGAARVGFGDAKLGIDEVRDVVYAAPFGSGAVAVDWATAATSRCRHGRPARRRTGGRDLRRGAIAAGCRRRTTRRGARISATLALTVREARADAPARSEADLESGRERA